MTTDSPPWQPEEQSSHGHGWGIQRGPRMGVRPEGPVWVGWGQTAAFHFFAT